MKRRDILKLGAGGLTGIVAGGCAPISAILQALHPDPVRQIEGQLDLTITEALVGMVDGELVYHWVWADSVLGPSLPGPVILHEEGYELRVNVTNALDEDHAFAVIGENGAIVPGTDTGPIPPGGTASVTFAVPQAGTYMYIDPLNAPVNRVLGLHGALISLPETGNTPYSNPTPAVQQLFDDLGTTPQFPKNALSPAGWQPERFRIWLQSQIDPTFNARAQDGATIDPADLSENFLPRYFTINGKSGAFAAHDETTELRGRIGEPMLVRLLNAGLFTHSNHLHANHFYVLAVNNGIQDNVLALDTFTASPLDRVDWLVPYIRPPDIAGDEAIPLRNLIPNELALVIGRNGEAVQPLGNSGHSHGGTGGGGNTGVPQSPLEYPMHCHVEMSQTAAGGNYAQGSITHFEILGDLDGVDFPHAEEV